ncbi:MAG TPA: tripartite tricarboxylate transporter permease [Pararhodobacter sp.]|uniref:tripartite tricarboxylate transporter permease n=1 Tax=Pararhodobacter sp. TaxID=2127056 RepID=UPI002BD11C01|nr:tripartite tricarboxylate transporter permease [Pararhodobacter sp.]HPD92345.1 tripartite tricarboxylate transporter permease [Pararhodobacter sp.]
MTQILAGFPDILNLLTLAWIVAGVAIGYLVGALPGLGKATAVAIAIPLTFALPALLAIAFLIGIAKGSAAGSAVSAILLNVPGEPSSAPTALDGYPLARQGKAGKALKAALFASVLGDLGATLALVALAQPIASYALAITPVEICAVLIFSLTFVAGLSAESLAKGLVAALLGLLVATVGLEIESGLPRLTFGDYRLFDGIPLIPMAIGMLAVAEMILQAGNRAALDQQAATVAKGVHPDDSRMTRDDWRRAAPAIVRGTAIGIGVGILPGLGASVGSFLSYGFARSRAKDPGRFGKGAIEGVAASESADNAVVPASLIPLFALGIPGSVIAAILIGAFMLHGVAPGPLMFAQQPRLVGGIYAAMIAASLALLLIGLLFQGAFARVVRVPTRHVVPVVLFLCVIGAWIEGGGAYGVQVMLVFSVLGVLFVKLGFSVVNFLIGFVIGRAFELSLRQSIQILGRDPANLVSHPIALIFLAMTAIAVWRFTRGARRATRQPEET